MAGDVAGVAVAGTTCGRAATACGTKLVAFDVPDSVEMLESRDVRSELTQGAYLQVRQPALDVPWRVRFFGTTEIAVVIV